MLAIDRLKRISGSMRRLSSNKQSTVDSPCAQHVSRLQSDESSAAATYPPVSSSTGQRSAPAVNYNVSVPGASAAPTSVSAYDNVTPRCSDGNLTTFLSPPSAIFTTTSLYHPNLNTVAELSVDGIVSHKEMSHQCGHHAVPVLSHTSTHPAGVSGSRGLDSDGDVTPTNVRKILPCDPVDEFIQSGVVNRPSAYVVPTPKPVAMVTAKAKPLQNGLEPTVSALQSARSHSVSETTRSSATNFSYGTLPRKFSQKRQLAVANGEDPYSMIYADAAYGNATCSSKSQASSLCLERSKECFQADANSNCHVIKKEPPVPPKRTHSFKTDLRMPVSNVHASSLTNSIPHAPTTSSCSNGGSFKSSAAGNTDLFGGAENILSEVIERLERGSSGSGSSTVRRNTGPRLGDWQDCRSSNDSSSGSEDSDSGLESRHSESTTSLDCSGGCNGNSSADMNTLPFANENVGTIKQRGSSSSKPSVVTVTDSGSVELNSSLFTPTTSSRPTPSASVTAPA